MSPTLGGGNDRLNGGAGAERLYGEGGGDSFVFAGGQATDRVLDFHVARDRVDYSEHGLVGLRISDLGQGAFVSDGHGGLVIFVGIDEDDLSGATFLF